jgi:hypothetical protein
VVQNANAYLDGLTEARRAFFRRAHEDRSQAISRSSRRWSAPRESAIASTCATSPVPGGSGTRGSTISRSSPRLRTGRSRSTCSRTTSRTSTPTPPRSATSGPAGRRRSSSGAGTILPSSCRARRPISGTFRRPQLHLLDAGHFALEEQPVPIATTIVEFLERLPRSEARAVAEERARPTASPSGETRRREGSRTPASGPAPSDSRSASRARACA